MTHRRQPDEDELSKTRMSFGEHLQELRTRIVRSLLATVVGFILVWIFVDRVMLFVVAPYREAMEGLGQRTALIALGPAQGFFNYTLVALIVGMIAAAPVWIWQIWAFIGAGLYRHERRVVYRYFPLCLVLFAGGVVFGYSVLIPLGLNYLLGFTDPSVVENYIGLSQYLSFFALMTLLLGVIFQFPVVMIGLARMGIVGIDGFRKNRRLVIIGIFILAAVVTPSPDPVSQCLLGFPLWGLYEFGVYLAWLGMGKARPPIDWKVARRRARKMAIVALVVFLFREPIFGFWLRSQIASRLAGAEAQGPDVRSLSERLLREPVHAAIRLSGDASTASWAVITASRLAVVDLRQQKVKDQVVDANDHELVANHSPAGLTQYVLELPERVPFDRLLPGLLEDLEYGSEDVAAPVRQMLEKLTGVAAGGSIPEALEAYRTWYDGHRGGVLKQR